MPKTISMATKREWLEKFEKGVTETRLASTAKRDIRTIKKGLDDARRERVSGHARLELIKDAMRDHNKHLLSTLNELNAGFEQSLSAIPVPWENQFEKGTIQSGSIVARYEDLVTPKTIEISLEIELKPEWELLKEHLKRDQLWPALKQWKKALASYLEASIHLKILLASKLEENTGYQFSKDAVAGSFMYLHAVDFIFIQLSLKLQLVKVGDFENYIHVDQDKSDVKYFNTTMAHSSTNAGKCMEDILKTINITLESDPAKEFVMSSNILDQSKAKVKAAVNEILLMGLLPGQCRICSRLGV